MGGALYTTKNHFLINMPNVNSMKNTKIKNKDENSVVSSHGETRNEAFRSLRNSSFLSKTEEILAFVFCSNTDFTGQGKNILGSSHVL